MTSVTLVMTSVTKISSFPYLVKITAPEPGPYGGRALGLFFWTILKWVYRPVIIHNYLYVRRNEPRSLVVKVPAVPPSKHLC